MSYQIPFNAGLPNMSQASLGGPPKPPDWMLMDDIDKRGMPGMQMTPQVNPMPTPSGPAALPAPTAPKQSLWDRVQSILMPQTGMASLLDDNSLGNARQQGLLDFGLDMLANSSGTNGGNAPRFGQALAHGVQAGQHGYAGAAQQSIEGAMTAQQIAQQQNILAARRRIQQQYAPSPTDTPEQTFQKRAAMIDDLMRSGDYEGVKAAGSMPGDYYKDPQMLQYEHWKEPLRFDRGGDIELRDPFTMQLIGRIPKTPAPINPDTQAFRDAGLQERKDALSARNEARLVTQYTGATKKYSATADALQAINENREAALNLDPIAQQTLLQDFVKLNLPNQQVTAGELHNYAGLMGLGEKGQVFIDKLRNGTPFSRTMIERILKLGDGLAAQRKLAAKNLRDQYGIRADRMGVPRDALPDWFEFLPDAAAGAAPTTGKNPMLK